MVAYPRCILPRAWTSQSTNTHNYKRQYYTYSLLRLCIVNKASMTYRQRSEPYSWYSTISNPSLLFCLFVFPYHTRRGLSLFLRRHQLSLSLSGCQVNWRQSISPRVLLLLLTACVLFLHLVTHTLSFLLFYFFLFFTFLFFSLYRSYSIYIQHRKIQETVRLYIPTYQGRRCG